MLRLSHNYTVAGLKKNAELMVFRRNRINANIQPFERKNMKPTKSNLSMEYIYLSSSGNY
jgi:hypothetical protein